MTYNTLYVKDAYINTVIYDDSAVVIPDAILPKRLTVLQPIFSSKGKANIIQDFDSGSMVSDEYGSDMDDLEKYGQGGMNLLHAMSGGASAQVCRLLPNNATIASSLVKLVLTKVEATEEVPEVPADPEHSVEGSPAIPAKPAYLKAKVVVDDHADPASVIDGRISKNEDGNEITVPLFKLVHNGAGNCGNDFGFTLENDYERDADVDDGRRYKLTLYLKDSKGQAYKYGESFYFSLNPDAKLVQGSEVMENLQYVFANKDTSGRERPVLCKPYIMNNYEKMIDIISEYFPNNDGVVVNPLDIDPLACTDEDGNPYTAAEYGLEKDPDEQTSIGGDVIYYLNGGSDGDLQVGYKYTKKVKNEETGKTDDVEVTVTEELVEETKISLLQQFFKGQVDPAIFDERMIFSDILFDANYDMETKEVMLGKFRAIRPDIMVIADIGTEAKNCTQAINLVKGIKSSVDGSTGYSAAVIVHAGYTTDRALNKHVTGTYDYAYGLAKCYGLLGTFSVFAGYQSAKVTTMEFDWLPYKDEFDTMLTPLRKLGCIFAFKIDRKGTVAYMSEDNLYTQETSKLKSIRNGMVIGDAVRLGKSVLIKYVYDNDGAASAIRKASQELAERLSGRYPSNITVTADLYQTERDKLLESSTCDLTYYFPGMTKGWQLNIYAKRGA